MNYYGKNLYEILENEEFRKRTGMFIGENRIHTLKSFIDGFLFAEEINSVENELFPPFENFHNWIADYFKWGESTAGWHNIILQENNYNETLAIKSFFELFDLFRKGC